jgi:hypothetical protein
MGDRTRADLTLIKECSRSLSKIHREFANHSNPADDYDDAIGHGGLKDAFDDFSDTWKDHQKKLMQEIQKLADATKTAAQEYDEIDRELVKALQSAKAKGKKGK